MAILSNTERDDKILTQLLTEIFDSIGINVKEARSVLEPNRYEKTIGFFCQLRKTFEASEQGDSIIVELKRINDLLREAREDSEKIKSNPTLAAAWEKYQSIKNLCQ